MNWGRPLSSTYNEDTSYENLTAKPMLLKDESL